MIGEGRTHGLTHLTILKGKNKEIVETFIQKRKNKNIHTSRTYQTGLDVFFSFYEKDKSILDIEKRDLMNFFDDLDIDSDTWSLETKKTMFSKIRVFLKWVFDYYSKDFYKNLKEENQLLRKQLEIMQLITYITDNNNFSWRDQGHRKPESNKNVVLNRDQVKIIFDYLREYFYNNYMIYRTILDTGCRRGEVISINISRKENSHIVPIEEDINNRLLYMIGKKGEKVYYISEGFKKELLKFLETRKLIESESKAFFLTHTTKMGNNKKKGRYHAISVYQFLRKKVDTLYDCGKLKEPKMNVSPHTLRKTTNTLRFKEGCSEMNLKILLGHKTKNVNIEHYLKLNREEYLKIFDDSYPYYKIF